MSKAATLRQQNIDQLKEQADVLSKELMNIRFQKALGEQIDVNRPKQARREIARIHTVIHELKQQDVA